jgi:DNA-directed RNA polymerase specialized sigma24 family protein
MAAPPTSGPIMIDVPPGPQGGLDQRSGPPACSLDRDDLSPPRAAGPDSLVRAQRRRTDDARASGTPRRVRHSRHASCFRPGAYVRAVRRRRRRGRRAHTRDVGRRLDPTGELPAGGSLRPLALARHRRPESMPQSPAPSQRRTGAGARVRGGRERASLPKPDRPALARRAATARAHRARPTSRANAEALLLRYGEELAYEEMAEVLRTGESTLRSRVHHGLRVLRTLLEKHK